MIRLVYDVSEQQVSAMAMTLEDMDDLMGRMTLAEKIGQLVMMGPSLTAGNSTPRIGSSITVIRSSRVASQNGR